MSVNLTIITYKNLKFIFVKNVQIRERKMNKKSKD